MFTKIIFSEKLSQDLILNAEQMPQFSRSFASSNSSATSSWLEFNNETNTSANSSPTRSNTSQSHSKLKNIHKYKFRETEFLFPKMLILAFVIVIQQIFIALLFFSISRAL